MDGFLQASCVARRLSDIYSPIFSPATFLSLCDSLRRHESRRSVATCGVGRSPITTGFKSGSSCKRSQIAENVRWRRTCRTVGGRGGPDPHATFVTNGVGRCGKENQGAQTPWAGYRSCHGADYSDCCSAPESQAMQKSPNYFRLADDPPRRLFAPLLPQETR